MWNLQGTKNNVRLINERGIEFFNQCSLSSLWGSLIVAKKQISVIERRGEERVAMTYLGIDIHILIVTIGWWK